MKTKTMAYLAAACLLLTAACSDEETRDGGGGQNSSGTGGSSSGTGGSGGSSSGTGGSSSGAGGEAGSGGATLLGGVAGEVTASVTCTGNPATDCAGDLYLGLFTEDPSDPNATPVMVGSFSQAGADLDGTPVGYSIQDIAPGDYFLSGFLDETSNADPNAVMPDTGDIVRSAGVPVTIQGGMSILQDLALDFRMP